MKNTLLKFYKPLRKVSQLSAILLLVGFVSCKKEQDKLVPSFIDSNLNPNFIDTTTILHKVILDDSIVSTQLNYNILGAAFDPVFGQTKAAIFTQINLGNNFNVAFGNAGDVLVADSLILSLKYNGSYASKGALHFKVHELNESIDENTTYYSNKTFSYGSSIGEIRTKPNLSDSVLVDGIMSAPQVRVKLDLLTAQKILNASSNDLVDNDAFVNFFKGLAIIPEVSYTDYYVRTDGGQLFGDFGSLVYLDLVAIESKATLYYHNLTSSDTASFDFMINSEARRVNRFEHDYSKVSLQNVIGQSPNNSTESYIQSMAGVITEIEFPYIENIKKEGNAAINKAELVIPVKSGSYSAFENPAKLLILIKDTSGAKALPDDFYEGATIYNGTFNASDEAYSFGITRTVHDLIQGNLTNKKMYLVVSGAATQGSRVVINSGKHPSNPMKLKLYYTNFNFN
jgi:hypothetical protein